MDLRAPDSKRGKSLAARLVLIFAVGSGLIMAAAGYALYHALGMQHAANEIANIDGRTQAVEDILRGVHDRAELEASLPRLQDLKLGDRDLEIGVSVDGRWAAPLSDPRILAAPAGHGGHDHGIGTQVALDERSWLVRRIDHPLAGNPPGAVRVVIALETTETQKLLRSHAVLAALVTALGTLLSALLGWFAVRRGLAPLAGLAERAEEVTAQHLGARLDLAQAPRELHGLADSINRMLQRLEESFASLEQFSADIAHELRTPLNNLLLQTQVTLSRDRSPEEYREALHSNLEELERLQHMVAEMLFLARAERGMIELRREPVDLREEAESVVDYFEAAAAEKNQAISIAGSALVVCDRSLARRAITNLVSNAVRYAPAGAAIAVGLAHDAAGSSVAVTNPGPPLAPAELQRLFTRFARRDESRSRDIEGAGLGLAIVDSIMKLQAGRLEARSEGSSVTFRLVFPAQPAGERKDA